MRKIQIGRRNVAKSQVHPIDFQTKRARQGSESSPWRREPATDADEAASHWRTAYLRSNFALWCYEKFLFRRPTRPSRGRRG